MFKEQSKSSGLWIYITASYQCVHVFPQMDLLLYTWNCLTPKRTKRTSNRFCFWEKKLRTRSCVIKARGETSCYCAWQTEQREMRWPLCNTNRKGGRGRKWGENESWVVAIPIIPSWEDREFTLVLAYLDCEFGGQLLLLLCDKVSCSRG